MEKIKNKTKAEIAKNSILLIFVFLTFFSCRVYKYNVSPELKETHRMIRLKVNYKDKRDKYSGKVIVLKQSQGKKIFILNPLGRVHFKLIVDGEKTTAIHMKKKFYWTGIFVEFIKKFWGIDLSFDEFYNIVKSGKIPDRIKKNHSIKINIKRDENMDTKLIEIRRDNLYLKIKILKNIEKSGRIDFKIDKTKLKKVTFNKLFN